MILLLTLAFGTATTPPALADAESFPPSPAGTWKIIAAGHSGTLVINVTSSYSSEVSGTAFGNPIQGFWDQGAQKLTFMRIANSMDLTALQVYTGCFFKTPTASYLTGSFEAFNGGGMAERSVFGWYASK